MHRPDRWALPAVPPQVARRRRLFFTGLALFALVISLVAATMLTQSSASVSPSAAREPTGCTLRVGSHPLRLTNALAMTLTDVAGRDQNADESLAHTAAAVAAVWPAESAQAQAVATALRGYVPAALACTATLPPAAAEGMQPEGLTRRASTMWQAVKAVFGPLPAGGFMPGGVHSGHVPGSAHYEGRAIDFLYRPISAKSLRHGWVLAQWLEAHATDLQLATVIFDERIWTPGGWDAKGWRSYVDPEGPTTNRTLLHEDHVHVDVQRGT